MTKRTPGSASTTVVVDGSNIATEGRTAPSLAQLDEAVRAFVGERPHDNVVVVVDATFGHRIASAELPTYEEAILAGELVTPPAGAIGRGDAFVLQIADKAAATVLSNDSFQEFHGTYDWLFDEGRLIGGKPVPSIGWVFVPRSPVRGPASRKSVREARKKAPSGAPDEGEAPPRTSRRGPRKRAQGAVAVEATESTDSTESTGPTEKAPRRRRAAPAASETSRTSTSRGAPLPSPSTSRWSSWRSSPSIRSAR